MTQRPEEWTLEQAAEFEDCHVETVRRWIREGSLVARSDYDRATGRRIRYVNAADASECARRKRAGQHADH
jgi:predicted site-specific integrase-resolvase